VKEVADSYLPKEAVAPLGALEEAFLTSDSLSTTTVEEALEQTVTNCYGLQPKKPVIVGLGDPSELWYQANPAPEDMDSWDRYTRRPPASEVEEIEAAFSGIRHHVAEGLRTAFPGITFIVAGGREGRIALADGG
jgi:hypothetical protein